MCSFICIVVVFVRTSYLAGKLGSELRENQPDLGIDNKDILCLEVAGLCHDLGNV